MYRCIDKCYDNCYNISMKNLIKKCFKHFSFFNKPQKYQVSYQVELINPTSEIIDFAFVLPAPLINDYQSFSNLTYTDNARKKLEEKYLNSFLLWNLSLQPKNKILLQENFVIQVKPRLTTIDNTWHLADYENIKSKYSQYLKPNKYLLNGNINYLAEAKKIIGSENNLEKILKKINNFVIKNLQYKNPIAGLYSASQAWETKQVDCGGFSTLTASLLMSLGIPCRIVSGFWAGYKYNAMHAWSEILMPNEKWFALDPTIENLNSMKSGRLGFVGSDRITFSVGCDLQIKLSDRIVNLDILQNPYISDERIQSKIKFITTHEK